MSYLVIGVIFVILQILYRVLSRPVSVDVIESGLGNRIIIVAADDKPGSGKHGYLKAKDHVDEGYFTNNSVDHETKFIGKSAEMDIEAPEGMSFISPESSEFVNSSFASSSSNEVFIGENYHGLKVINIRDYAASIMYKGTALIVDLSKRPLIAVDGVIIQIFAFKSDGDKVDAISINGLMLHSKSLRASYGVKLLDVKSSLQCMNFNKTTIEKMSHAA